MTRTILQSEEHFSEEALRNGQEAECFVETLCLSNDAGLLVDEIIMVLNSLVVGRKTTGYSSKVRATTYQGQLKVYCPPEVIEERMDRMIDRFNYRCFYTFEFFDAVADFIVDFLTVHPFADGNGRTVKYVVWYLMKSHFTLKPTLYYPSYDTWCRIISTRSKTDLVDWLYLLLEYKVYE